MKVTLGELDAAVKAWLHASKLRDEALSLILENPSAPESQTAFRFHMENAQACFADWQTAMDGWQRGVMEQTMEGYAKAVATLDAQRALIDKYQVAATEKANEQQRAMVEKWVSHNERIATALEKLAEKAGGK